MKYIKFVKKGRKYLIWNKIYKCYVGEIRKEHFGRFLHWQLFSDGEEDTGFTNGCLKEITEFITSLYRKDRGIN